MNFIPLAAGATLLGLGFAAYQSTRYAWWTRPQPWHWPRVLMYHMVSDHRQGARFNKLRVPPDRFEQQVRWLADNGFSFVHASALAQPQTLPPKPVCLTFDDGYRDNLEHADPVLARHGACATLYLVGDRSGGWSSKKKAHHADDELASEPKLSDEQVRALLATGRWELGGHTDTHENLPKLDDDAAAEQIASSRKQFPAVFDTPAPSFAYPFGLFGPRDAALTRAAGYTLAMRADGGLADPADWDPMAVPRIKISGKDRLFAFKIRIKRGRRGW